MKEDVEVFISWCFPVINLVIIVLAATRRELKGKAWLVAQLTISLVVALAWRVPEVLLKFNLAEGDVRVQFYQQFGLPLGLLGVAGFCLLIPYVLVAADTKSSVVIRTEQSALDPSLPPPVLSDSPYRGYGGWLAVFGAVQLFVQPVLVVLALFVGANGLEGVSSQYPMIGGIFLLEAIAGLVVVGLGMRAAIKLRGVRPGAVRAAKLYLKVALGWSVVSLVLPYLGGIPDSTRETMTVENVKVIVRTLVSFAIWYSYFNVSRRVKATYAD